MKLLSTGRNICQTTFLFLLVVGHLVWGISSAYAIQLYDDKGYSINLDTTLSWGAKWRVQSRDFDKISTFHGGDAGHNGDNGNLNFDKGLISNAFKITSELEVKKENFGLFVRGTAFYDYEIMHNDRQYIQLGEEGEDQAGQDADLLDAYVWVAHDFGDVPVIIKVGEQVVSWGESTFIKNGINTINPMDAGAIRVPGAEIREALIPEGMVWASVAPTLNTSIEALYLYDWGETQAAASGTYFSTNDYGTPDGFKVVLPNSPFGDLGDASVADTFMSIGRSATREADDSGQFGMAFRVNVPALNDTEFGLFYLKLHSRMPVVSATTGTGPAGLNAYLKTAKYYTEYTEDIETFGLSFATEAFSWSIRGEVSHKEDVPFQIDDDQLITAAIGAISPAHANNNLIGNYLGQFNTDIPGYLLYDVTQAQVTLTKSFGPMIGADGWIFLTEAGYTYVHDLPDVAILESPSGIIYDAGAWGYRSRIIFKYLNAIGPVNLFPRIGWNHDVHGTTPSPGRTFLNNRKSIMFGLKATYQSWAFNISYTNFFGAEEDNKINDRDFIGCSLKYSF